MESIIDQFWPIIAWFVSIGGMLLLAKTGWLDGGNDD